MVGHGRWCGYGDCAGPDVWGGAIPISGAPSMTGVLEPPSGSGASPVSVPPSITGVLESACVRGAIRSNPNFAVGDCDAPDGSRDCSGHHGSG